jgi:AGCS family alanine or glycine:cation symporter
MERASAPDRLVGVELLGRLRLGDAGVHVLLELLDVRDRDRHVARELRGPQLLDLLQDLGGPGLEVLLRDGVLAAGERGREDEQGECEEASGCGHGAGDGGGALGFAERRAKTGTDEGARILPPALTGAEALGIGSQGPFWQDLAARDAPTVHRHTPPRGRSMASRTRVPSLILALVGTVALAAPAWSRPAEAPAEAPATEASAAQEEDGGILDSINAFFEPVDSFWGSYVNYYVGEVFFYDVWFWDNQVVLDEAGEPLLDGDGREVIDKGTNLALAAVWLIIGAIFFTFRMGFINVRAFTHAIDVTRGKFSNPEDAGEVSHFQALTAALSATVGLGNIAGVAIAVSVGGPGATFWMILAGLLGMSLKFTECSLGQMYREVRPDGRVMGGAMFYLSKGLAEVGKPRLGKVLATIFAVVCVLASFAGGNAFQVKQSVDALALTVEGLGDYPWIYGLIMSVMVGVVILGGIKRIAATAEKIVPLMCGIYVAAALFILGKNIGDVPGAFGTIVRGAFTPEAGYGGFIGVLIMGFRRAAFSNEAGAGSAAIAHSAARTPHPTREGIVALLEPFIDTVVVCTMTALVIVITGAYNNPEYAEYITTDQGAALTSKAFGEQISWFPYVLSVAVVLFAYSTMISWSYYGERCWAYLFGDDTSQVFRVIFVAFVFLGSILSATNVLGFGDLMILGLAFPNLFGIYFLTGKVRASLDDYMRKLHGGEFKIYK